MRYNNTSKKVLNKELLLSCPCDWCVLSLEQGTAEATTQNMPLGRDNKGMISATQILKEWPRTLDKANDRSGLLLKVFFDLSAPLVSSFAEPLLYLELVPLGSALTPSTQHSYPHYTLYLP